MSARDDRDPGDEGPTLRSTRGPRVLRVADEAEELLNREEEIRNFDQFRAGDCWVISRSIMGPVYVGAPMTTTVQLSDKPQSVEFNIDANAAPIAQVLQPPNGTIKFRFQEADPHLAFWKLMMAAKRLRNTLAFVAEVAMPLRHVVLSKSLMWRFNHDVELQRYHPEVGTAIHDPKRLEDWYGHIDRSFDETTQLLSQLTPDSPLARAVSLVGGAVWADDPEDGFLSAWRAVDVVAKLDYSELRESVDEPSIESEMEEEPWSDSKKIRESLVRRIPGIDLGQVGRFNELRGRIAHDTVTTDLYRSLYEQRWVAFDIASRSVRSCLQDQKFAVPERGPLLHP